MKIILLLCFILSQSSWAQDKTVPLKDASVIHGKIFGKKNCTGLATLWVAKQKELLYQVETPINGSFEFHLLPGDYNIAATTENGCQVKQNFKISKNESKKLEIKF